MKDAAESGYRLLKHSVTLVIVVTALVGATVSGAFAHGTFDGSEKVGKVLDYGDYSLASSTYAINVKDTICQYATGEDGNVYCTSKNGQEWSKWEGWDNQPVNFTGDPAPISYLDQNYAFLHGEDDHIYHLIWNADGTSYFADVSGDYTFKNAPHANIWQDQLFLLATGTDGYVWESWYTPEAGWSPWKNISGEYPSSYKPYAVAWGEKENVFWTGDDGKVYWSRYDGSAWSEWVDLGTNYDYSPLQYEYQDSLYLTYTGEDGCAWYKTYAAGGDEEETGY